MIVAAQINGCAATGLQLRHNRVFAAGQRLCDGRKRHRKVRIIGLCRHRLCPVAGKVIVASAVVVLPHLTARRLAFGQQLFGSVINGFAHQLGRRRAREPQAFPQGTELTQAVPAQVVLLDQLLHVLGRRATSTRFKQTAALHQLHNRQHLGRCANLKDREQIRQVIAQHVAGDRDAGLALTDRLARGAGGRRGCHDLKLVRQTARFKHGGDVFDQLGIVGAVRVQPENRAAIFCGLTLNRQLDPVQDWVFARRRQTPDVARLNAVAVQHVAVACDHLNRATGSQFKRRRV